MLINLQFTAEEGYDVETKTKVKTSFVAKGYLLARGLERPRSTQAPCGCAPSVGVYQMYFPGTINLCKNISKLGSPKGVSAGISYTLLVM